MSVTSSQSQRWNLHISSSRLWDGQTVYQYCRVNLISSVFSYIFWAQTNYSRHYWLCMFFDESIKCQERVKMSVTSSQRLRWNLQIASFVRPTLNRISFLMIENREKQQSLIFEKLQLENVSHFSFIKDFNDYLMITFVLNLFPADQIIH